MSKKAKEQNIRLNRLSKMQDELYHNYASSCGLSSASFWVLYSLCETDEVYTQNQLAQMWCFPKQTVNSAISTLVKMAYIKLEQLAGARNSKSVHLTELGLAFCEEWVKPLIEAELRALSNMPKTERKLFLELVAKQFRLLQNEIDFVLESKKLQPKLAKLGG